MSTQYEWPTHFTAIRARFQLFGMTFRILSNGKLILLIHQRAMKLKEDIVAFADTRKTEPRLRIRARNIIDFSATYDVEDAWTGEAIGAFRRQGVKSLFRDTWEILDTQDQVIGSVLEDSGLIAIIRRLIPVIPQTFFIRIGQHITGTIRQRFNLIRLVYDVRLQATDPVEMDPRLGLAATILMLAIEGRQR